MVVELDGSMARLFLDHLPCRRVQCDATMFCEGGCASGWGMENPWMLGRTLGYHGAKISNLNQETTWKRCHLKFRISSWGSTEWDVPKVTDCFLDIS